MHTSIIYGRTRSETDVSVTNASNLQGIFFLDRILSVMPTTVEDEPLLDTAPSCMLGCFSVYPRELWVTVSEKYTLFGSQKVLITFPLLFSSD